MSPDHQVMIYAEELRLLKVVFSASSDLILARHNEEFRELNGGIEKIESDHAAATKEMEDWYDQGE